MQRDINYLWMLCLDIVKTTELLRMYLHLDFQVTLKGNKLIPVSQITRRSLSLCSLCAEVMCSTSAKQKRHATAKVCRATDVEALLQIDGGLGLLLAAHG
jgi:hypothetical protein